MISNWTNRKKVITKYKKVLSKFWKIPLLQLAHTCKTKSGHLMSLQIIENLSHVEKCPTNWENTFSIFKLFFFYFCWALFLCLCHLQASVFMKTSVVWGLTYLFATIHGFQMVIASSSLVIIYRSLSGPGPSIPP